MSPTPDFNELLEQAQKMMAAQQELSSRQYEGRAGGGAVVVKVVGSRVTEVAIDPQIADPADLEMLADLVMVAVNQALDAGATEANQAMGGIDLGSLGLSG